MDNNDWEIEYGTLERYNGKDSRVVIPDGVAVVGADAFAENSRVTSVTIPDGVRIIAPCAFRRCVGLTELIVSGGNPVYRSANNCIIETKTKTLAFGCKASVIPRDGSVTKIGRWAFFFCDGLAEVDIPESVTSIEAWAFGGCNELTRITIPGSVKTVGACAFSNCGGLTSAEIVGATEIEKCAFSLCGGLTSVTIPITVERMGENVFDGCAALTDIYCAAQDKPDGWSDRWLGNCKAVVHRGKE